MDYGLVKREGVLVLTDLDVSGLKIKRIERAIDQSMKVEKQLSLAGWKRPLASKNDLLATQEVWKCSG
jgi:5S rRNA maturation endonuclease (ribonuclease M5)